MIAAKLYIGFWQEGGDTGYSFIAEDLSGQLLTTYHGTLRKSEGKVLAKGMFHLIKRYKDLAYLGIYTDNPKALEFIERVLKYSRSAKRESKPSTAKKLGHKVAERRIKVIVQEEPVGGLHGVAIENARYAIKHRIRGMGLK